MPVVPLNTLRGKTQQATWATLMTTLNQKFIVYARVHGSYMKMKMWLDSRQGDILRSLTGEDGRRSFAPAARFSFGQRAIVPSR